jgi:hypothetical protein
VISDKDKISKTVGYGTFNKKYDWDLGIEREDIYFGPESDLNITYAAIWKKV